jgi:hydrogenase maturation protease
MGATLFVGFGHRLRRDDAAGLVAAARLREAGAGGAVAFDVAEVCSDGTHLLERWEGRDSVTVIDAVRSGAAPGTVHCFEAGERPLPAVFGRSSTHHLGLAAAIELARVLGRLPRRLVVLGIEGADFGMGEGLTPAVDGAVDRVVAALRDPGRSCRSSIDGSSAGAAEDRRSDGRSSPRRGNGDHVEAASSSRA